MKNENSKKSRNKSPSINTGLIFGEALGRGLANIWLGAGRIQLFLQQENRLLKVQVEW